jgi:hypothetical protein
VYYTYGTVGVIHRQARSGTDEQREQRKHGGRPSLPASRLRAKADQPGEHRPGYGPRCAAKIRAAAKAADLSAWTPRQVEQARELIEDGGLVPAGRDGVFLAVSTDGTEVYRVAADWCECPAGLKEKSCYHRCAVVITIASTAPAVLAVQPLALAA